MRTLTVAGGNLFRIAAEQLGDATQWIRIAQLNAIADPMLTGLVTLRIPDPTPPQAAALSGSEPAHPPPHRPGRRHAAAEPARRRHPPQRPLRRRPLPPPPRHRPATAAPCSSRARSSTSSSASAAPDQPPPGRGRHDPIDVLNRTVEIDGRDLTARLLDARTQETFSNQTASEIAETLAARHGLTADVTATTTLAGRYYATEHDRITLGQFSRATTEWDLLTFLAAREGFEAYVAGQTLTFAPARRRRPR